MVNASVEFGRKNNIHMTSKSKPNKKCYGACFHFNGLSRY